MSAVHWPVEIVAALCHGKHYTTGGPLLQRSCLARTGCHSTGGRQDPSSSSISVGWNCVGGNQQLYSERTS